MNVKIVGASSVIALIISFLILHFFSVGIGMFILFLVLFFFAAVSVSTLIFSVADTIRLLNEKPPFAKKVEELKMRMRTDRREEDKEQIREVKGRLEQLVEQGKDPFETGIYNLEKITKKPEDTTKKESATKGKSKNQKK